MNTFSKRRHETQKGGIPNRRGRPPTCPQNRWVRAGASPWAKNEKSSGAWEKEAGVSSKKEKNRDPERGAVKLERSQKEVPAGTTTRAAGPKEKRGGQAG